MQKTLVGVSMEYATDISFQQEPNAYYCLAQFKTFLQYKGNQINLSDGGFVDWTQQLLSNKKHRLFISGIGTELVYKLMNKMI